MAKMNFTAGFIGAIYRYILPVFLLTMISGVGLLVAQERESVKELEPLRVIEGELGRYGSRDATAALRNSVPILETPVSVQVVPKQVMEDQAAEGLEDVYRNISGVVQAGNTLNAQSEVLPFIRGFEAPVMLRNGMRATTVGAVDLLNIESVEILKGPASILFGGLEPGGVLNYTTKRPSERKGAELSLQFGSYENYRVEMDATGPLVSGESLLFRVNAAYTDSESFRNHLKLTRAAVAPSLLWRIDSDTTLNVDFSYSREEVPYDSGIPLGLDGRSLTPAGAFFGDPELKGRILEDIFTGYTLEHRINRVFTLRTQFQYHRSEPRNESIRHRGVRGEPGAERLRLRYQNEDRTDVEYQFILDMLAEFNTGGLDHSAMIGIDWTQQETDFDRFRQNLPDVDITAEPVVRFAPPEDLRRTPTFRDQTEWIAIYFQDQISLLEESRLKLLLGGRWDQVEEDDQLTGATSDSGEFTGRIGALYELNHWLSPYASATQSFLPAGPSTVDREGVPLDPERGVQYEAGLKFQFFEQRLLATIAAYRIQKKDVAIFDLPFFFETGNFAWLSGVDQRSQGVELDVVRRARLVLEAPELHVQAGRLVSASPDAQGSTPGQEQTGRREDREYHAHGATSSCGPAYAAAPARCGVEPRCGRCWADCPSCWPPCRRLRSSRT